MTKENVFHQRRILSAKLNDLEVKTPIIVAATGEELSHSDNHFKLSPKEQAISRLQLFVKKGKMFAYQDKQPTTKITKLASDSIAIFGKLQTLAPVSIMQNDEMFSTLKEKTQEYLSKVLKVPTKENQDETYLEKMVNQLYLTIKKSFPERNEIIHLATMERDLTAPEAGKNRLTAEFGTLLLTELRKKIAEQGHSWQVELDRVLALKQRTSRAEAYGIQRIAQQPLMLYQSKNIDEEITVDEKVIIVDDHIQAGAAISSAASEVLNSNANLLSVACISAHKNSQYFNIQSDVQEFIVSLLPQKSKDLPRLNDILHIVGLSFDALTNVEGIILSAMLCEPANKADRDIFESLLKKYDASKEINYGLFTHQENSLMEEFEKPKVEFRDFENTLLTAIEKGRYTVPYEKQVVLTDEDGRSISREAKKRGLLPWILFDFDDTLHNLADSTFHIFQNIIKEYSGVEVAVDTIRETRQTLKEAGKYQYQDMLLSFIKQHNPESQVTSDEITKAYQVQKNLEPFIPKMSKEDFLNLRNKYRIGIITDGSEFPSKVPKMKEFYGVDIDGYVYGEAGVKKKPDLEMYKKFCKTYHVTDKPIAYVGDKKDLDGAMAINANLKFIKVDPTKPVLEIQKFNKELGNIEEQRKLARKNWGLLRGDVVVQRTTIQPAKKSFGVK